MHLVDQGVWNDRHILISNIGCSCHYEGVSEVVQVRVAVVTQPVLNSTTASILLTALKHTSGLCSDIPTHNLCILLYADGFGCHVYKKYVNNLFRIPDALCTKQKV